MFPTRAEMWPYTSSCCMSLETLTSRSSCALWLNSWPASLNDLWQTGQLRDVSNGTHVEHTVCLQLLNSLGARVSWL